METYKTIQGNVGLKIEGTTFRSGIIKGSVDETVVPWFASSGEDERRVRGSVLRFVDIDGCCDMSPGPRQTTETYTRNRPSLRRR
jgi:hypothetical protein